MEKICGGEIDNFTRLVADTRNALTHMQGSRRLTLDHASRLSLYLTIKLTVLFCILEAQWLGLPLDNLEGMLAKVTTNLHVTLNALYPLWPDQCSSAFHNLLDWRPFPSRQARYPPAGRSSCPSVGYIVHCPADPRDGLDRYPEAGRSISEGAQAVSRPVEQHPLTAILLAARSAICWPI